MTLDLYFIINVVNVIIISIDNFICALLYAIERVHRLPSLNPEYNHNHNHTCTFTYTTLTIITEALRLLTQLQLLLIDFI